MKMHKNIDAITYLRDFLRGKGNCANCMWTRQVMRETGFTNGQIRCAVLNLKLKVQKDSDSSAYGRTFDAWILN